MADLTELLLAHLNGGHSPERHGECPACQRLPQISPGDPPPPRRNKANATSPTTGRKCGCGCGSDVKHRYLPGHDAKHKSALVKRARQSDEDARQQLEELGWAHFI